MTRIAARRARSEPGPAIRRRRRPVAPGRLVAPLTEPGTVPSPGGWTAPANVLPGWNWGPPHAIVPRTDRAPRWVRWWYATPLIDRYAPAWMWHHGAWDVQPPPARNPGSGEPAGVREPRRPVTPAGTATESQPPCDEHEQPAAQLRPGGNDS